MDIGRWLRRRWGFVLLGATALITGVAWLAAIVQVIY